MNENRTVVSGVTLGLCLFVLCGSATDLAYSRQVAQTAAEDVVGSHPVSSIRVVYNRDNAGLPSEENLMNVTILVSDTPQGMAAPIAGQPTRRVRLADLPSMPDARFTDTGLVTIAPAVVQRLKDLGLVGVYVIPDAAEFRVEDGRVVDMRPAGQTGLTLQVTTGTVTDVRTIGVGERLKPDKTVNNPIHAKILRRSPVQAGENEREGGRPRTDLLRRDLIEDFVFRLNRQPGRRVDTAVSAPGDTPGAVQLDYMVTENRPWLLFAQLSNTGSGSEDAWRQRFGFIHNDLSNNDDILTLDYQTANFRDIHALYGSYDRPFGDSERWRWNVHASYYRYVSSDLGFAEEDFRGEGWDAGAGVKWNFYQHRDLFLDLLAGVRFEHITVDNEVAAVQGENDFLIPSVAVRLERFRDAVRTEAQVGLDFNLGGLAGTDEDTIDNLGRTNADADYAVLRADATHSFYVDQWFHRNPADAHGLANEFLFALRGQHALGNRLIPHEEMAVGGLYTVRGYPYAVVAGDNVVIGTAEYRYHVAKGLSPRQNPGTLFGEPFRWRAQYPYGPTDWDLVLKAFIDAARVTNSDSETFENDSTLVGAGVGAEFSLTRRFSVRADLGFALEELDDDSSADTVDAGHAELYIVVTVIF